MQKDFNSEERGGGTEVNIFDFQQTIYGQIIRVDFLKMLRREIKFTSVDALLNQMKKDVKQAKAYFVKE